MSGFLLTTTLTTSEYDKNDRCKLYIDTGYRCNGDFKSSIKKTENWIFSTRFDEKSTLNIVHNVGF